MITKSELPNRIKPLLCILVGMAVLFFFYGAVVLDIFGGTVYDRLIYGLGAITGGAAGVCAIMALDPVRLKGLISDTDVSKEAFRTLCFAVCMLMTLYYYDSSSDYGHTVGLRIIMSCFGVVLLTLIDERHRGWSRLFYMIPGAAWVLFGYLAPKIMERAGALNYEAICYLTQYDEEAAGSIFWQTMAALPAPVDGKSMIPYILWGFMVMIYGSVAALIIKGSRKKPTQLSYFGMLLMLLFLLMLVFSNGRLWTVAVALPFGMAGILPGEREDIYGKMMVSLCRGVMLSFWIMGAGAIIFRPYYSFEFVRWPGWFSSVASAGLYRMLVCVSAMCMLIGKKGRLYPALTLGASLCTLVFGMSRTSILATGLVMVAGIIMTIMSGNASSGHASSGAASQGGVYSGGISPAEKLKAALKLMLLCAGLCILMLPGVYTAIRCIPALVARPVWITRAEWFSDRIMTGERPDSTKYMNVPQLAESLLEKLAGVDINLSSMAGAVSGPGEPVTIDEDGNEVWAPNVVGSYEGEDGQTYYVKDYSFTNDESNSGDNGRLDILSLYAGNLNITGHGKMIPDEYPDGMILYHAHNSYMQVFFDHGILTGIVFLLVCAVGLIKAFMDIRCRGAADTDVLYPFCVMLCFMCAAMTEWIFHPSIPIGFAFMTVLSPFARKNP